MKHNTTTKQPTQSRESVSKHTPGEWKAVFYDDAALVISDQHGCICKIEHEGEHTEEHEANAQRIVACVNSHDEMLQALLEAERSLEILSESDSFDIHDKEALNMVSAAIAKATPTP